MEIASAAVFVEELVERALLKYFITFPSKQIIGHPGNHVCFATRFTPIGRAWHSPVSHWTRMA
jgi:hypothetical protein